MRYSRVNGNGLLRTLFAVYPDLGIATYTFLLVFDTFYATLGAVTIGLLFCLFSLSQNRFKAKQKNETTSAGHPGNWNADLTSINSVVCYQTINLASQSFLRIARI